MPSSSSPSSTTTASASARTSTRRSAHVSAQNNVGYAYNHGEGVGQDYAEAAYWYRLAAEQGNEAAQFNLGMLYQQGYGVRQDLRDAAYWYELAAAQGSGKATEQLDILRNAGLKVCNNFYETVYVAYAASTGETNAYGQDLFESQGWREIAAGNCSILWDAPFRNRYYYVFAESDNGHWGGDYYFCTLRERFRIVDTQCEDGYEREGFTQIEIDDEVIAYTFNLNP